MKITKLTIITSRIGTDLIILHTDLPSTMPNITIQPATFKLDVASGYGLKYVNENIPNVPIEIINTV